MATTGSSAAPATIFCSAGPATTSSPAAGARTHSTAATATTSCSDSRRRPHGIWHPAGATDLFEGGGGNDTAQVNGGNDSETFTITANGARVRLDRISRNPFSLRIGTTENLVLHAGGGDDTITAG